MNNSLLSTLDDPGLLKTDALIGSAWAREGSRHGLNGSAEIKHLCLGSTLP